MAQVKLIGNSLSPYNSRVTWALKLKGIPYEFIEENPSNKGPLLLQYNPIHKKIPVLLHVDKPICESIIILEYLDETWPANPLLPTDPYERAAARFWINFIEDKIPEMWAIYRNSGAEQEKAVKDSLETLKTIEEHAFDGEEKNFFGGNKINMVDIAYGGIAHRIVVIEEVVDMKILEPHKFPRLHAWTQNFRAAPVIKDNLPDPDQLLVVFKRIRETILATSA